MALLVSLVDMKSYLGETSSTYDDFLTEQLTLMSSAVEGYCSRIFTSTSYTQTMYKSDFYSNVLSMPLYHYPLTVVATVKEITSSLGVDTTTTTLETYEYRINLGRGSLLKLCSEIPIHWFSSLGYDTRIEIAYTAGYITIPPEIDSTVKGLVAEKYEKNKSGVPLNLGPDVQSIAIPGVLNVAYDYSLQANERKSKYGMIIGNYANVLDSFRSERALIGEVRNNYVV